MVASLALDVIFYIGSSPTRKLIVARWRATDGNASDTLMATTGRLAAGHQLASSGPPVVILAKRTRRRYDSGPPSVNAKR